MTISKILSDAFGKKGLGGGRLDTLRYLLTFKISKNLLAICKKQIKKKRV
jgi:hypothetical protein